MIELRNDKLCVSFPEVHPDARLEIEFQRTLRLPDDNQTYPLPPGLGKFPLKHVDDYSTKLSEKWHAHGGVFFPMYQSEALWINFGRSTYPFAIKIAAGKTNAVTGEQWSNTLNGDNRDDSSQDYLVSPGQLWLDGFAIAPGKVRQFVAMPLGEGFTAEEQITGQADVGGIQIIAYPMKREKYEELLAKRESLFDEDMLPDFCATSKVASLAMGLAPGGLMRQQIFTDEYGINTWDTSNSSRCFVHLMNSEQYESVVGEKPPTKPPTPEQYSKAGLPWFDYWKEEAITHPGSKTLADLDGIASTAIKQGKPPIEDNQPVEPKEVVDLSAKKHQVREGVF